MSRSTASRRRWLVPEVVQTSAMDCGPAVLKGLLEGFYVPVHYGRLREACQTEVDGTSIDVLESVAARFGLQAEQVMVPVDHLLLPESKTLPAILVVRLPNGFTHFVLLWRRHGPLVQVLDPSVGRRWVSCRQLLDEVYVHTQPLPATAWRDWAGTAEFLLPLERRLRQLGLGRRSNALIERAAANPRWHSLAALDAATRLLESLVESKAVRRGREAGKLLASLSDVVDTPLAPAETIPQPFWSVLPARDSPSAPDADTQRQGEEQVRVRGAVLVRIRGRTGAAAPDPASLGPELAAAVAQPRAGRPSAVARTTLRHAGFITLAVLALGLLLTASGNVFEGLLLRGILDVGRDLGLVQQRLGGLAALTAFIALVTLADLGLAHTLLRLGRQLEMRFRTAFAAKLPRLIDRYFQSRPISDMADRAHRVHQLRSLPLLAARALRSSLTIIATALAIAWTEPRLTPLALVAAALAVAIPWAFMPMLQGLDLKVRTHDGALGRFYLDALLGLAAIRAHGAERSVRREHESLLVEWARARKRLLLWSVLAETVQAAVGFSLASALVMLDVGLVTDSAGALLLAYWALSLPLLGQELALLARRYPLQRSTTLRLLEPLTAPDEPEDSSQSSARPSSADTETPGASIDIESVSVRASGHEILRDIDLRIPGGSHIAVVGPSGAGKSSLVGLLLGWHRPASGRILVDGRPLDPHRLGSLRERTAWVDPAVHLWNRSLLENLRYGLRPGETPDVAAVLEGAELFGVLKRLPAGFQEPLGESGGLLSGGEAQRVRLGRAQARTGVRLAILDEPFRGLDRAARRRLLAGARKHFQHATLLCVTHDLRETLSFDRVLVIESGRIVEDGSPAALAADPSSRFRALLDAEEAVRAGLWAGADWDRRRLDAGSLAPDHFEEASP